MYIHILYIQKEGKGGCDDDKDRYKKAEKEEVVVKEVVEGRKLKEGREARVVVVTIKIVTKRRRR